MVIRFDPSKCTLTVGGVSITGLADVDHSLGPKEAVPMTLAIKEESFVQGSPRPKIFDGFTIEAIDSGKEYLGVVHSVTRMKKPSGRWVTELEVFMEPQIWEVVEDYLAEKGKNQ